MKTAHNYVDLTGQKFNRLVVIGRAENNKNGKAVWICQCECGNYCKATTGGLKTGNNQSCGCLHKETFSNKKHGKRNTRLYRIYAHMKCRCYDANNKDYMDYGGRGISVCDEWLNDFDSFYRWAIKNGYKDELTIERMNVDGNYEPTNCTWATRAEQCNNKRSNILITFGKKTQNLKQWSDELGTSYTKLYQRLYVRGWSVEKAFTTK